MDVKEAVATTDKDPPKQKKIYYQGMRLSCKTGNTAMQLIFLKIMIWITTSFFMALKNRVMDNNNIYTS